MGARGNASPGTSGRYLLRFAGTLDDDSARQMIEAIRHFEQVEGLETAAW
jgi:hypothetical protein